MPISRSLSLATYSLHTPGATLYIPKSTSSPDLTRSLPTFSHGHTMLT